ncbi:MAG: TldD/PmbA family protein [Desulfurococcaceae archaeon]
MVEDLLHYIVDYGLSRGASYVEARYHKNRSEAIIFRNNSVLGIGREIDEGIGIRVIVNGTLGFTATTSLDREIVRNTLDKLIDQTRSLSTFMKEKIEFADAKLGRAVYEVSPRKKFDTMSIEEKIKYGKELWSIASKSISEARVSVLMIQYFESIEEKIIVNSDGAYVNSKIPRIGLFYNIVINHPAKGSIQKWEQLGASGGLEWIDVWKLHENIPNSVKTYEKILLTAQSPPKDTVDVVVGSEIVGLIAHESCGHPSEADRIWGREAAQAGKSFIKKGMIGEKIGTKYATVIDDPTIPGSYGFYLYDDEGVPARARYLYKEGYINEHLHNRWTAKVFGTESNASARAMNYRSEPIIRMANTYLKPGDYSFEELIEDIKHGVYIKSFMEWNIDDERWSQRYVGLEAYLIENGELKDFVKNPVLEITTKSFYSSIDAAGRELKFYAATCGKGEPSQGVPVWTGGPDVRLRNIKLGVSL